MRRVLFLSYYFPPLQTAAVARNVGLARHLPAHGWTPTVLTVDGGHDSWGIAGRSAEVPTDMEIARCPETNLDRPVSLADGALSRLAGWLSGRPVGGHWCRELLCVPDPQIGWRARRRGAELAAECDCIHVSCSPYSSALIALALKRRTGRPLVVDFRDAWSLNPYAPWSSTLFRKRIERLERRVIAAADRVILNTPGALRLYCNHYPQHAERFDCVPNGYDALNPAEASGPDDPFTVMHVGTLYGGREPGRVLQALAELDRPGARFVQVGESHPQLEAWRDRLDITVTGQVDNARALELMRSASLLYLRQGYDHGAAGGIAVAAKTYEYLATGLPILAEAPPGDNADIVARYAPGGRVITEPDARAVKEAIASAWRARDGRAPTPDPGFVREFDRARLAGRLASNLEQACEGAGRVGVARA